MKRRWGDLVEALWRLIIPLTLTLILGITQLISPLLNSLYLSMIPEPLRSGFSLILNLLLILLVAFLVVGTLQLSWTRDIRDILDERLPSGGGSMNNPGSSKRRKKKKVETSGSGAIMGLIIGALIGLPYGPIYTFILGLVGAFIGDLLEYEGRKRRRS